MKVKFPYLSDAKIKECIFVGPQIRQLVTGIPFDFVLKGMKMNLGKLSYVYLKEQNKFKCPRMVTELQQK